MAKVSENRIPNIDADWGNDVENGLPYSGEAVQEFIKNMFRSKYGYFHYDESNNRYLVFADEDSKKLYFTDSESYRDLLLTSFDAPFNYSAKLTLISNSYNAVLIGTTGNVLQFHFGVEDKSGNNTGENVDCSITITNAGVKKSINKVYTSQQGIEGVKVELDDYITEGTNNVIISLKGQNTLAATTAAVVYQVINLQISDVFDLSEVYESNENLSIPITIGGYGSKTLEWYLDGEQLPFDQAIDQINSPITITNTKNISLDGLDPGVHSIQYRVYTIVEGQKFYSQTLFRNFFIKGLPETLIGVATELPIGIEPLTERKLSKLYGITQYVPYSLRYAIYNPANVASNDVSVYLGKELYSTGNAINDQESLISLIINDYGLTDLKISVNGSNYIINTDVTKSSINIYEIASNLVLDLRAFGRNNLLADKDVWTYGDYSSTFEGFYWNAQSGWNDNSLIINSGSKVSINYAPFAINPTTTGKTLEFEFATRNVVNDDSVVLDLTTDDGTGLLITASEAILTASDKSVVSTKFKSGENNRITFVVNVNENGSNPCLMFIYVNGIICGAANYAKAANIRCPKEIVFDSDVDIIIKQLRFYDRALSSDEILNNYILYRDNVSEMLSIYTRNDIYDALSEIDPEKIVNYLPVMYFTCLHDPADTITGGIPALEARTDSDAKDEEIYCAINYVNAQDPTKNFSIDRSRVRLQGTSSIKYPKKNWRFYTKNSYGTMLDYQGNIIKKGKYSFTDGAIPTDRWCLKTDYAESSSSHNTGTSKIWNDLLTKAVVTYSNPTKSSYYVLNGVKEDNSTVGIYTFYDKENEKLNDSAVLEARFKEYRYEPVTRDFVIGTGLNNKAVPVSQLPDISDITFKSDLFVMLPDKNGVVGEYALRTKAQQCALDEGYKYNVRTAIDGFPIVVFYRITENDPWIFLGKHNFNDEKSSVAVFGFEDIPGFDNSRMQCWELTNNNHEFGLFKTTEGFYDPVMDDGKEIFRWELAFEARYPDEGSNADTSDLKRFADWMCSVPQDKFAEEKWDHLDVYKMAAYYVYLMRFGAVDQVVKNSMLTSEDGEHFYFINYDNDTILGVKNDGRLVFDPTIDRQSPDPDFPDAYAYAGHESTMWNRLEADEEFMEIVKQVDHALGNAGMSYESMIDMYENKQTKKWCERIYNRDAQLKYINPFNTGVYSEGLFSLQGTRNSHRRWWLSERFNIYDAKFVTGSFKTQNIWFKLNGAPIGSHFTITSGKNLPYGYEITNGASEISDFIPVDDKYKFIIPQGVSVGDPVLIYGATNIKGLDLSNVVPYLSQVSFTGAYSESTGFSSLEEINMQGTNVASNVTISGLDSLYNLRKMNISGIAGIKELNLKNSLNLQELIADNSGLNSIELAPGCLIELLRLPNSLQTLKLIDLPLLNIDGLYIENDWKKVSNIIISGCPNLTSDFNLIWNWYNNTKSTEGRVLEMSGLDWKQVNIDNLIELGTNVSVLLKGQIEVVGIDDKNKLLILKDMFGNKIFDKDSDLYIYSEDSIFVFGPDSMYEGESVTFETIIFSKEEGTLLFATVEGERRGVEWADKNLGILTSVENGLGSVTFKLRATYIKSSGRVYDDITFEVQRRIYPEDIFIVGSTRISEDTATYTWDSNTIGITGQYTADWVLDGDILNYVEVGQKNEFECTINRKNIPETITTGNLTLYLYKKTDGSIINTVSVLLNVVNPDVIMTYETNPVVLNILYRNGLITNKNYLLKSEAKNITQEDIIIDATHSIFSYNTNMKNFDEFEYFTGITTIPSYCFSGCSSLTSIKLPISIQKIELGSFNNTMIEYIQIPENVTSISKDAFPFCTKLKNIDVHYMNPIYVSIDGNVYENDGDILCLLASGIDHYVMPSITKSVASPSQDVWKNARSLQSITFNDKISNISGEWFLYGFDRLIEIIGPDNNPNFSFVNGCIYDKELTKLIYVPSGKVLGENDLLKSASVWNEYCFVQNKQLTSFIFPDWVKSVGRWAFYKTSMFDVTIPEGIEIANNCFSYNDNLTSASIYTSKLNGEYIFYSCSKLETVGLYGDGLKEIMPYTFAECGSLRSVSIPESVTKIRNNSFYRSGLREILLPGRVSIIETEAFAYCYYLGTLTCLSEYAPTVVETTFGYGESFMGSRATNKILYVLSGSQGFEDSYWGTLISEGFYISKTL